jgi:hypothetical protein
LSLWSLAGAACSSPAEQPTAPSGTTVIQGVVVRHRDGAPVVGARVALDPGGQSATTDAAGQFDVTTGGVGAELRLTASAAGFLDRAVIVPVPGAGDRIEFDMIREAAPFSLDFYRRFARGVRPGDGLGGMTLRPWTMHLSFYVRSITEDTGELLPGELITGIERLFRATVPALSGGRAKIQTFEVGSEPRPEAIGWVIVTFSRVPPPPYSPDDTTDGVATVGGNQGRIWIRYDPDRPDFSSPESRLCGHRVLDVADHEIVHTMGFWHTQNAFDFRSANCDGSSRTGPALYHSEIAYSRPPFNLDPDLDVVRYNPLALALSAPKEAGWSPRVVTCDLW